MLVINMFPTGIDDENEMIPTVADHEIIDDSALLVEEKGVLAGAGLELFDVVGQHFVEPGDRARAAGDELAHVRDVEHADGVADGEMFFDDAAVLHWHEPAAKGNDAGTEADVLLVKRRFFVGSLAHGERLDGA